MAGGNSLASAWELAVLFVFRPVIAVAFVLSFILLSWYVAWRTVLVHVPLVQEITGLRRKKPVKPKPLNRGRIARFYESQAQRLLAWAVVKSRCDWVRNCFMDPDKKLTEILWFGTVNEKGPLKE